MPAKFWAARFVDAWSLMSMPDSNRNVVAILLAAGAGRRFDPSGNQNKLLATINGNQVAVLSARHLIDAGLHVLAVVRPDEPTLAGLLAQAGCEVTVCEDAALGMGHSLAHGVATVLKSGRPDGLLIALADMPFVNPSTIDAVSALVSAENSIVAAATNGIRGHPVAFWRAHFDALTALDGDQGAGGLLRQHHVTLIEADDDAVIRDIDQPKDLPD